VSSSTLLARTAALIDIPSVSHGESALADVVEEALRAVGGLEVTRVEDNVIARTRLGRPSRVLLAGHLDTVPPAGNERARLEGERLYGVGSADMKGGLAVMLDLAESLRDPVFDLSFVFYACEEVARRDSGLGVVATVRPDLLDADVAVLLEPTSAKVEAGCQGVIRVAVTLRGRRAHSARPWAGVNAIHRVGPLLDRIAAYEERRPVLDGCEYHETLQAVAVEGGGAGNVIPDTARVVLSHRFAPDRDAAGAYAALVELLSGTFDESTGDRVELLEEAPAARPSLDHPVLGELVRLSGDTPRAKVAWTDVAFFAARGVPAANFGPGDSLVAHSADEAVDALELGATRDALWKLLSGAEGE